VAGEYHADGLRVDAVASMLYLDYGRNAGEWIPNQYGGRENVEAVDFIKALNTAAYARDPGIMMIAEESTSWPAVSRPIYLGGLGFGFKWDMGWMHDTIEYFSKDPIYRRYHHRDVTFGFCLRLDRKLRLAALARRGRASQTIDALQDARRSLAAIRQSARALRLHVGAARQKDAFHGRRIRPMARMESRPEPRLEPVGIRGPSRIAESPARPQPHLSREPALWEADGDPAGFHFIDADNVDDNVIAFMRIAPPEGRRVICACNFSPVTRNGYRVGVPADGLYREILNTDSNHYGGSNVGNSGAVMAESVPHHGLDFSLSLTLPPLAVIWLEVPQL
jgi:1,4-alpha-glucan branching enzyme